MALNVDWPATAQRLTVKNAELAKALAELLEASEIDGRDIPEKAAILLDAQQRARKALEAA